MNSNTKARYINPVVFIVLLIICIGIYSKGLNGPFVFDDSENIENNSSLRISQLNFESISSSALSGRAGPLKRPVAMLSFALNYYFSGELNLYSFKLTNVILQAISAWLLFIFCLQILKQPTIQTSSSINKKQALVVSFSIAMLWAAHPINLTSVLYIVQRMALLSTLFSLATLILYIKARSASSRHLIKNYSLFLASFFCFLLAIFSKENALLIPAYIIIIEWVFFPNAKPWSLFSSLSKTTKNIIYGALTLTIITTAVIAFDYASAGYGSRTFTLVERGLTEARVVCFYLSLIILPRINEFGIFHDDIPISTSIIDPWTTLLSFITIIGLLIWAVKLRKPKPLISFGIIFFFACHLLESTIFGLEIAHEHRNHLASIGVIIALMGLFIHRKQFNKTRYTIFIFIVFIVLSATTILRSNQWQSDYSLALYEASHHPKSPATLGLLSTAAFQNKEYALSIRSIDKARLLDPSESAYAINHLLLLSILNKPVDLALEAEVRKKLTKNHFSPSTQIALAHISTHLTSKGFTALQPYFINWLKIIIGKLGETKNASIYQYFLAKAFLATGDNLGAINAHQHAFNLDRKFLNPLFEAGNIFLALKQPSNARIVLAQIEEANANPDLNRHYDKHIEELKLAIQEIEKDAALKTVK
ncbi:MAG: hypothetical protein COB26_05980 [Piscirickettsiaceae bacterium]|nr:MAG: hypothetical protein COB26_05980 [Piscirickettsiaceae bacterium]